MSYTDTIFKHYQQYKDLCKVLQHEIQSSSKIKISDVSYREDDRCVAVLHDGQVADANEVLEIIEKKGVLTLDDFQKIQY